MASRLTVVMAAAALVGASAFADSRPSNGTRSRGSDGRISRSGGSSSRVPAKVEARQAPSARAQGRSERGSSDRGWINRSTESARRAPSARSGGSSALERDRDRSQAYRGRSPIHREDNREWREDHHSYSGGGGRRYARQPFHHRGAVSRIARFGSGYHVWLGGAPYPFYVPYDYYHRNRFRVGLFISLGGYYNPRGYYDYYDYNDYPRYSSASRGEIRGYVESVDYRRDTFVVRNEATGSFVTVVMRDRRRDVREGDFVEVYGEWSRSGLFQAYDVDLLDDRRRY